MTDGKKYYEVSVADDGPGIPDDMKGQLFRRFKGEGVKASGHGLGLYLVKTIVEDFGGRVRVEDRVPGDYTRGAKFVVLLSGCDLRECLFLKLNLCLRETILSTY